MPVNPKDPIAVACELIREASLTPCHDGAQDRLAELLTPMGFSVRRYPFEGVDNLYARLGSGGPHFCFAGHTDVVPVGDASAWTSDPFDPQIRDGMLYGRGAADMKGSIAAFVAATARFISTHGKPEGSISFLITGDEEGPSIHGTRRLLPAIYQEDERIDHCLVGEPTSEDTLGDVVKNGRRGSLNGVITARGRQGHAAYPEKSTNPIPVLLKMLGRLSDLPLDEGSPGFQPSRLVITTIDVGNPAHNVIPATARAKFNIRFNPRHTGPELTARIRSLVEGVHDGVTIEADLNVSGEAFYTEPGSLTDLMLQAIRDETGRSGVLSTSGGTSDARFIKDYCPVAELGLRNESAHKVDEHAGVDEIETLSRIYYRILTRYFAKA
ncbi:MAG: succinyl-diaminopimelate desuccinylase [Alphaproteobacteria bacterium]|nr:succinyl-diaminopimelate desuccinylase [Alphaproteobacteria bacterium]